MNTTRTMLVRPNPAHARDHLGEPCAAVPFETQSPGAPLAYVGARIDFPRSRTEHRQTYVFDAPSDPPVSVPLTAYYTRKLEEGELLAADALAQKFSRTRMETA